MTYSAPSTRSTNDLITEAIWQQDMTANLEDLYAQLSAIANPTGRVLGYVGTSAPSGWVLASGLTIGDASSGGTERANADTSALFALLWNSMADSEAAVSGGRGASAAADFAAHKTIALPDLRGRVVAGKDDMGGSTASRLTAAGSGITGTTQGKAGGTQTHTLVTAEMPAHTHVYGFTSTKSMLNAPQGTLSEATPVTTSSTGGGGAHQNTQPTLVLTKIIKL